MQRRDTTVVTSTTTRRAVLARHCRYCNRPKLYPTQSDRWQAYRYSYVPHRRTQSKTYLPDGMKRAAHTHHLEIHGSVRREIVHIGLYHFSLFSSFKKYEYVLVDSLLLEKSKRSFDAIHKTRKKKKEIQIRFSLSDLLNYQFDMLTKLPPFNCPSPGNSSLLPPGLSRFLTEHPNTTQT